jgi:hypothetical protein
LAVAGGPAIAADSGPILEGRWTATTHDGGTVEWEFREGRIRIDGRPADLDQRADSLIVSFDPPAASGPEVLRERAVYRFVASTPSHGPSRLFVFGFDLGRGGLSLVREEPRTEDAAPAVPEGPGEPATSQAAALPKGRPGSDR